MSTNPSASFNTKGWTLPVNVLVAKPTDPVGESDQPRHFFGNFGGHLMDHTERHSLLPENRESETITPR